MDGFAVTDILSSQLYEIVTLCFNIAGSRASHARPFLCPELAGSGKFPCLWRNLSFDSVIAWLGTFSHVTTYLFMHRKLDNYLRTHRKRAGLSQDEVAYLLGCRSGAKVSRYERFARHPTLQTALAYEAIFGVAVRELFVGLFQKVERPIVKRARLLAQKLKTAKPDRLTTRKLQVLRAVASVPASEPNDHL